MVIAKQSITCECQTRIQSILLERSVSCMRRRGCVVLPCLPTVLRVDDTDDQHVVRSIIFAQDQRKRVLRISYQDMS